MGDNLFYPFAIIMGIDKIFKSQNVSWPTFGQEIGRKTPKSDRTLDAFNFVGA
jgi:hypothetical protein